MQRIFTILSLLFLWQITNAPLCAQSFLGKSTLTWTQELERPEESARRNAAYALGKLGSQAAQSIPNLLERLQKDSSPKVREAAAFALGEIGRESINAAANQKLVPVLANALKDENSLVRRSAAFALGNLGNDAAAALDALDSAMSDPVPAVRQNVAWALGKLGGDSLPSIRKALVDTDSLVQRDGATALASFDPKAARPALDDLLGLCLKNNSEVRKAALGVIVKIVGPDDKAAVAPLRQALLDPDSEVRANAALALSNIGGKNALAALPLLRNAMRTSVDVDLRRQAAVAIRNIGPEAKDAVPDLVEALRDPDEETRTNAALALGGIGENAASAVPALVRVVADPQQMSATRIEAAVALSRIGPVPAAVQSIPTLLQVLENPNQDGKVRERIIWSLRVHKTNLRNLPGIFPAFTKVLTEQRQESNRMLRYDCAYMLGVLQGSQVPPEVMAVLLEYLKDDTILIFDNTKTSVGGTGQETNSGKANVKEVGRGDGRTMALQALAQIGAPRMKENREIIEQLRRLAQDPATFVDLREGCKKLLKTLN
jgi:HEAT repeat protein